MCLAPLPAQSINKWLLLMCFVQHYLWGFAHNPPPSSPTLTPRLQFSSPWWLDLSSQPSASHWRTPTTSTAPIVGGGGIRTQVRKEVTFPSWTPWRSAPPADLRHQGAASPSCHAESRTALWFLFCFLIPPPTLSEGLGFGKPQMGPVVCEPHPHCDRSPVHTPRSLPTGERPLPQPACRDTGGDASPAPGNLSTYVSGFIIHACPSVDRFSLLPAESGNTEY